ncbi:MAG: chorismate synthase [Subdoligranulum variabile]|nr:chorismate synthase [Subdoligranulum variabile]MDD6424545.1 chorismate synthase [Subdoligranulum variabile]
MKNTFGNAVSMTIFGESHGPAIGAVLDGLAAGLPVDEAAIAAAMDRRRARGDGLSTARTEADAVEFLSGVFEGHTTGTAVAMIIRNQNTRSGDYAKTAGLLRPGHADYTAYAKYEGYQDARGGGHFSGRITAASVAAGALCETVLNSLGIRVYTHIAECAGVKDAPLSSSAGLLMPEPQPGHFALLDASKEAPMQEAIRTAGSESDSVGGVLETIVTGLPAGIGEPWFDSVESELAHLMFAIPACKGLEFGAGFAFAAMRGSEANDPFTMQNGRIATATNKNGGINGGITNGMPLVFRTVLKPTPSIYKQQHTVDYLAKQDADLQIKGRHDPCIVPRAAVVQNTLAAFGLLDLLTVRYGTLAQKHGLPQAE